MMYGFAFFPGQGAQTPGMGKTLFEQSEPARQVFDTVSEVTGVDVAKLCFSSSPEMLSRTEYSQIAIFTHSMAAWAALQEKGVSFQAAAGFSLGEYTALAASGIVSLVDGAKIVQKRGQIMQRAADSMDGGMAAVLGLDDAIIEQCCTEAGGDVYPVNYNCPGQLAIAGKRAALDVASAKCKEAGARRVVPLAVSGAFHTPLLKDAAAELRAFVEAFSFHPPHITVYSNLDGKPLSIEELPKHLEQHMISPVRWTTLVQNGIAAGLLTGCEIGPGKTLTGFARKISKELTVKTVETMENVLSASE